MFERKLELRVAVANGAVVAAGVAVAVVGVVCCLRLTVRTRCVCVNSIHKVAGDNPLHLSSSIYCLLELALESVSCSVAQAAQLISEYLAQN